MKVQPLVLSFYLGPNPDFASDKCLFSTLSSWGHIWSNHSQVLVVYIEREAETHRVEMYRKHTDSPKNLLGPSLSCRSKPPNHGQSGPLEPTPPSLPELVLHIFPTPLQEFSGSKWEPKIRECLPLKIGQCHKIEIPFWTAILRKHLLVLHGSAKTLSPSCLNARSRRSSAQAMDHLPPLLLAPLWGCRNHLAPLQSCGLSWWVACLFPEERRRAGGLLPLATLPPQSSQYEHTGCKATGKIYLPMS